MEILEYFFEQKLKNEVFYPRKLSLPKNSSFLLFGARGVGKTSLIIDYIEEIEQKYLYIDAQDPIFVFEDIDIKTLNCFIKQEKVELLIIDHFFLEFLDELPDVKQLVLVSRCSLKDVDLPKYQLLPLDYEEFLSFNRFYSPESAFNYFLRLGTLPKISRGSIYDSSLLLRETFLEKFDDMESRLILVLAKFHSKRVSTNRVYTYAKEYFKISKDWTYKTIKLFQKEGIIYLFDEVSTGGTRKIIIYDFVLVRYLNKNISFNQIFDSIISLALIKHRFVFTTLSNLGYLILERNRLITPAPFETDSQMKNRFLERFSVLKEFSIKGVEIVTVSSRYGFYLENVYFEALPFYEWSIVSD